MENKKTKAIEVRQGQTKIMIPISSIHYLVPNSDKWDVVLTTPLPDGAQTFYSLLTDTQVRDNFDLLNFV